MYNKNFSLYILRCGLYYGKTDRSVKAGESSDNPPLTPIGLFQAEKLAKSHVTDKIDCIFSSTLLRAVETVYPTALKLRKEIILLPDLMETGTETAGTPENIIKKRFPSAVYPVGEISPAGGRLFLGEENFSVTAARAKRCMEYFYGYAQDNDSFLVATHRDFSGYIIREALGISGKKTFSCKSDNCSLTKIQFSGKAEPELSFLNYTGHLF